MSRVDSDTRELMRNDDYDGYMRMGRESAEGKGSAAGEERGTAAISVDSRRATRRRCVAA
jgi:hypothetical protein